MPKGPGTYGTQKGRPPKKKKGVKKVKVGIAKAAVRAAARPPVAPASRGGYACRVSVTKAGRGGKTVTIVTGLEVLPDDEKKTLLTRLKNSKQPKIDCKVVSSLA